METRPINTLGPIYAITDSTLLPGSQLISGVRAALDAGIITIQYRDKLNSAAAKTTNAINLVDLCNRYGAALIINDDPELALKAGAHGVHLGQGDASVAEARALLGANSIIGVTCHNQSELALKAELDGANYAAFGRFYSSSTKPGAGLAKPKILRWASQHLKCPTVAIGGITTNNMSTLIEHGANTLAVCHSLFGGKNTYKAARALLNHWDQSDV